MLISNRTALITGASRGLGRALALGFGQEGYRVYATARTMSALEALEGEARAGGLDIIPIAADVASPDDNARVVERVAADGRRLSLIVHNASLLGSRVPLANYPTDLFARVLDVNVTGPFDLTRRLIDHLAPNAVIQLVTSGVGVVGKAGWGAYSVSKFALEAMGQILGEELGSLGFRVQIIDPGSMRTRMRAEAFPDEDPEQLLPADVNVPAFRALLAAAEPGWARFKAKELGALTEN